MIFTKPYFNKTEGAGGEAAAAEEGTETVVAANLDALPDSLEELEARVATPEKTEEEKKAETEKAESEKKAAAPIEEGKKATEEKAKTDDQDDSLYNFEEGKEGEEGKPAPVPEEVESNWVNAAEYFELGKIEKDDPEEFRTALQNKIKSERETAASGALVENIIKEFPVETAPEVEHLLTILKSGKTITEFLEPLQPFMEVMAMDNEELVRAAYEGAKKPKEWIDTELSRLKEEGLLDHEGERIRGNIQVTINNKEAELFNQAKQRTEQIKQEIQQKKEKEDAAVETEISKLTSFMGGKINDKQRQDLREMWKGDFRKRFLRQIVGW